MSNTATATHIPTNAEIITAIIAQNEKLKEESKKIDEKSGVAREKYYYLSNTRIYLRYVKLMFQTLYWLFFIILVFMLVLMDKYSFAKKMAIIVFFLLYPFLIKHLMPYLRWIRDFIIKYFQIFLGRDWQVI
jgi:hypothetical protein